MKTKAKTTQPTRPGRELWHFKVLRSCVWWGPDWIPPGELITIAPREVRRLRTLLDAKSIERVENPKTGICKVCGCTWTRACAGGCSWANLKRTICSRCSASRK